MSRSGRISVVLAAAALGLAGCSLQAPKAPEWETLVNVPVTDHSWSVADLVAGEENFRMGADSLLSFYVEERLDTVRVADYLTFPDLHERFTIGVDAFRIAGIPVMADRFFWSQLTAQAAGASGGAAVVAPFIFNYVPSAISSSEDLVYAQLTSGIARLHLYNRLPIDLENLILTLQDPASGARIVSTPLVARVAALDSALIDVDMSGRPVPRDGRWLISGNSPGSRGVSLPVSAELPVDVVVELRDFSVTAAQARIPAITLEQTELLTLDEAGGDLLDEAVFSRGRLRLRIDNQSPFTAPHLTLQFPQITRTSTRQMLDVTLALQPFQASETTLDLTGMAVDLEIPPAGSLQTLKIKVLAETADMRSSFVEVGAATRIEIDAAMEGLMLTRFNGRLNGRPVRLDSTIRDLNLSEEWGDLEGIRLRDARLQVEIYSTIAMPLRFKGSLYGLRQGRPGTPFLLDIAVPAAAGGIGRLYTAPAYTASNSAIVDFINQQPEQLAVAGEAWIGDNLTYGSVQSQDRVAARLILDLPFNLSWEARQIDGAIERLEITPAAAGGEPVTREGEKVVLAGEFMERLAAVAIEVEIENRMPVAGELSLFFAADSSRLFASPDLLLGPVALKAAGRNAAGRAVAPSQQSVTLAISRAEMALFQNPGGANKTLWMGQRLRIAGSDGQPARFYTSDRLAVQALLRCTLRVGG